MRAVAAAVALLATAAVAGQPPAKGKAAPASPPAAQVGMRVDAEETVRLQQLYVTVTAGGAPVLDLGKSDFQVLDEGRPQPIVTFEGGDIPFTAVLLVDSSISMSPDKLDIARTGVHAFLSGMKELDEAKVVGFSDDVTYATAYLTPGTIPASLDALKAGGGTSLNDHLYLGIKLLEARQGRRVVVLLSDGMDVNSALRMREVLEAERHSQVMIYWIRPPEENGTVLTPRALRLRSSSWKNGAGHEEELKLLEQAVAESGGRIVNVDLFDDLRPAFREVLKELREQYAIGYYPDGLRHDQSWHNVEVKVKRAGAVARARGYTDF